MAKLEMQPLYVTGFFDYIHQSTNRTRQIAACKRTLSQGSAGRSGRVFLIIKL